ncbi:MAG: hypothetical protein PWQ74_987 [Methanobacteriaceae archaeon]|nr:hypothetical protein [Methanobacteriaceae archaeon]
MKKFFSRKNVSAKWIILFPPIPFLFFAPNIKKIGEILIKGWMGSEMMSVSIIAYIAVLIQFGLF